MDLAKVFPEMAADQEAFIKKGLAPVKIPITRTKLHSGFEGAPKVGDLLRPKLWDSKSGAEGTWGKHHQREYTRTLKVSGVSRVQPGGYELSLRAARGSKFDPSDTAPGNALRLNSKKYVGSNVDSIVFRRIRGRIVPIKVK